MEYAIICLKREEKNQDFRKLSAEFQRVARKDKEADLAICVKISTEKSKKGNRETCLKWYHGVPRIPGKYSIAEGCCRKIQNGFSMVLRLGTLNVGSLTGRSMEIAEMLERRRIDICFLQETRWKSNGVCHVNQTKKNINYSGMVKRRPKMVLEFLSENR
ncbi:hypothetical protein HELRODRAFT_183689 [Helobdella robusta]|uniref:Endonuclease/exonuclease/phosphatase domain-containing protein n=1 Tax=Helobdella robusta TaxID=6412 RepID=T1FK16_HELRO|nr:hypothetical protein HELRODRAFT_183689 [Helobdella robusta]ESO10365.1 hypothetical protein HELRODRAFT_183689 [Helobdella robusta]